MKHDLPILLITSLFGLLLLATNSMYGQHTEWLVMSHGQDKLRQTSNQKTSQYFDIEIVSPSLNIWKVEFDTKQTEAEVWQVLGNENVSYIFPNLELEKRNSKPNDFFFEDQWSLEIIQAAKAWEQTTGGYDNSGNDQVIAILDDGFDLFHEDLVDNYWINKDEIPDDGYDNDFNGYIDDVRGVNIQTGTGIHAGVKHGTQVAGIIGARGDNGLGIAGMSWNSQLLLVSGVSNIGEVIKSLEYLYQLKLKYIQSGGISGANIIVNNFSGGIQGIFPSDFPGWCDAYELLGTVGILSTGSVANEDFDVEVIGDMPTLCPSDYLIMVTNTDMIDERVYDAAFGSVSVDLGAPGENIISSSIGNDYELISGTSAAAPHVAGAVALLASAPCENLSDLLISDPPAAALRIKSAIINGTDAVSSLSRTVSGGRLNVFNSMLELREICGSPEDGKLDFDMTPNLVNYHSGATLIDISYKTDELGQHELNVFNINGQRIMESVFFPPVFEDGHKFIDPVNLSMAPGLYIVQLSNDKKRVSKKLVIAR